MSIHRFFLPVENFSGGKATLPPSIQSQLTRVLRHKEGDLVELMDGSGMVYRAEITTLADGKLGATLISSYLSTNEARLQLTLHIPLTQREKFEWILQKGTEIGVYSFQPYTSLRSLVHSKQISAAKMTRWQEIVREAAEQSGRAILPFIHQPVSLEKNLHQITQYNQPVFAGLVDCDLTDLRSAIMRYNRLTDGVHLITGPEGGFDNMEVTLMKTSGVIPFQLGRRVLRMETAAIVASSLILYESGDFQC